MFCILKSEDSALLGVIMGFFGFLFFFYDRFIRCHSAYLLDWVDRAHFCLKAS